MILRLFNYEIEIHIHRKIHSNCYLCGKTISGFKTDDFDGDGYDTCENCNESDDTAWVEKQSERYHQQFR